MDRRRWNEWLSIATNIAVVAGIIILAIEIRQNSVALRSNVLQSVSTESNPLNLAIATDASMRETWVQGLRDPDGLTESQKLQLNATLHVWFNNAQTWYYQMQSGVLDEEIADGHWTTMATMHESFPGFRKYWESRAYSYTPDFRRFVEDEVFTRIPLEYTPGSVKTTSETTRHTDAIAAQLDKIYDVSTGTDFTDARAELHLQYFAEQPIVLPPGQQALVGRAAVAEFYRGVFADVEILENTYSDLSIAIHGDLATRQYVGKGTFRIAGEADPQTSVNKMTDVLIRRDGEWKTLVHLWSPVSSN